MTQNSKQMNLGRVQAEKLYFYRKELNFNLRKEYKMMIDSNIIYGSLKIKLIEF